MPKSVYSVYSSIYRKELQSHMWPALVGRPWHVAMNCQHLHLVKTSETKRRRGFGQTHSQTAYCDLFFSPSCFLRSLGKSFRRFKSLATLFSCVACVCVCVCVGGVGWVCVLCACACVWLCVCVCMSVWEHVLRRTSKLHKRQDVANLKND